MVKQYGKYRKLVSKQLFKFSKGLDVRSKTFSPRSTMGEEAVKAEFGEDSWDIMDMESTCFTNTAYSPGMKILQLTFKDTGSVYNYYGVPLERFNDFDRALSKGRYYNIFIKGVYSSQLVKKGR